MKIIFSLSILAMLCFSASGQNTPEGEANRLSVSVNSLETLHTKRNPFSTSIYRGESKLRPMDIKTLYRNDTLARRQYRAGQILLPIAPLVTLTGIALSYAALKGKPGTYVGYYDDKPVVVEYRKRSRPMLAVGLGLFVAGIAMFEFSNELVNNSARQFNSRFKGIQSNLHRPTFHYGITPSGNIGLYARF